MGRKHRYHPGENLFACERCGRTYYSSQSRKEWTGAIVCYGPGTSDCWEPRHPQEFLRIKGDQVGIKDVRTLSKTERLVCTISGRSAFAGYAVAGCSIAGSDITPLGEF